MPTLSIRNPSLYIKQYGNAKSLREFEVGLDLSGRLLEEDLLRLRRLEVDDVPQLHAEQNPSVVVLLWLWQDLHSQTLLVVEVEILEPIDIVQKLSHFVALFLPESDVLLTFDFHLGLCLLNSVHQNGLQLAHSERLI